MHQVNIHEAKSQLSKFIQKALNGEEVIIARDNKPLVQLEVLPSARKERQIGGAKGFVINMANDFNEPLEDLAESM